MTHINRNLLVAKAPIEAYNAMHPFFGGQRSSGYYVFVMPGAQFRFKAVTSLLRNKGPQHVNEPSLKTITRFIEDFAEILAIGRLYPREANNVWMYG
jgi:hypothetical protein